MLTSKNNGFKLVIHKVQSSDAGTYKCVVSNASGAIALLRVLFTQICTLGSAQSVCSINVLEAKPKTAPTFDETLRDVTISVNGEVTLKCHVNGEPLPDVLWSKDGKALQSTRNMKLSIADDGWCELKVTKATGDDGGVYLCSAKNSEGTDSSQATVTVLEEKKKKKEEREAGSVLGSIIRHSHSPIFAEDATKDPCGDNAAFYPFARRENRVGRGRIARVEVYCRRRTATRLQLDERWRSGKHACAFRVSPFSTRTSLSA